MNVDWRANSTGVLAILLLVGAMDTACAKGREEALRWQYKGKFTVTRYTSDARCCGKWADGVTFTGTKARYGVVAVDPKVIQLGSCLRIEGFDGVVFKAEDVGGAIKGKTLDVWHYDYDYCLQWGKQCRKVWVAPAPPTERRNVSAIDQIGEVLVAVPKFVIEGIGGIVEAVFG